jgi:hypothetical protein
MRAPARTALLAALAAASALVAAAAARPAPAGAQPVPALDAYRWKRRVLVVLAPAAGAPGDSTYQAQRREFARYAEALAERDLVVLDLAPADPRAGALRRQLDLPGSGFGVALVGKDGGVKLRRRALLPAERVLATVDAMPMGAEEARRRRRGRAAGGA